MSEVLSIIEAILSIIVLFVVIYLVWFLLGGFDKPKEQEVEI